MSSLLRILKSWPMAGLLVLAQALFVYAYLDHEKAIHFWDYAMYANLAINAWSLPSLGALWAVFSQSFSQNYNLLYALPSFLSFSFLGATRPVFILTNTLVFFVAYQAAVAWVLGRVFPFKKIEAVLASLLISCALPFGWYPLLEGYPDHAAAACLAAGVALALNPSRSWRRGLALGFLCALAVIFRRHYAYAATALFAARGVFDLFLFIKDKARGSGAGVIKHFFYSFAPFYLSLLFGFLALLIGAEPAYFKEMMTTDFLSLYKSYERPPSYFLSFALSRLGLGLFLVVGVGLFCGLKKSSLATKRAVAFICLFSFLWLLLWAMGPAQAGEHYLIAVLPLCCAVGLASLGHTLWHYSKRKILLPALCGFLAFNSAYALWFAPAFVLPSDDPRLSVLSTPRPPWVRSDYDELKRLAVYLGQTTNDSDKIVIAGSSFIFNQDLVRALYTDVLKNIRPAFRFLPAPESDGQQMPPLHVYALANVYVVATPTQYHLDPEGQKVVTALAERFPPPDSFSTAFTKDDAIFHLDRGVTVHVWRRGPWSPSDLHEGLAGIKKTKSSGLLWVGTKTAGFLDIALETTGLTAALIQHPAGKHETVLFYDTPLSAGRYRLSLAPQADSVCPFVAWRLRLVDEKGNTTEAAPLSYQPRTQDYGTTFLSSKEKGFLFLETQTESLGSCAVVIRGLAVKKMN